MTRKKIIYKKVKKYKYCLRKPFGKDEDWTGTFDTKELADKWFDEHGSLEVAKGRNLVRKTTYTRKVVDNGK